VQEDEKATLGAAGPDRTHARIIQGEVLVLGMQLDAAEAGRLNGREHAWNVGRVGVKRREAAHRTAVDRGGPSVDRRHLFGPGRDRQVERTADTGTGEVRRQSGYSAVERRRIAEASRKFAHRLGSQRVRVQVDVAVKNWRLFWMSRLHLDL
jgi:hypothetical protein